MKPRFLHDCSACVLLGQDSKHDLYWCPQGHLPTVIARYGGEGPEYLSGLEVARAVRGKLDFDHPLALALTLAEKQGYLVRKPGIEFTELGAHVSAILRLDSVLLERKLRPVRSANPLDLYKFEQRVLQDIDYNFRFQKLSPTLRIAIEAEVERYVRLGAKDLFIPE